MIYRFGDIPKDLGVEYLFPPPSEDQEWGWRPTSLRTVQGEALKYVFWRGGRLQDGRKLAELAFQPCSVDVTSKEFTTLSGKPLNYPITIESEDEIVGHSGLKYVSHFGDSLLCAETRSRIARRGLACTGFYAGGKPQVFLHGYGELSFVLKNYSPNALIVTKPFSPVQISVAIESENLRYSPPLRLVRNGVDVTNENQIQIGGFAAYKVHLSDKALVFRKTSEPIDITGNDIEKYAERVRVTDLQRLKPDFCLTLTEEEVHTNGCPTYIYPFHYLDALEHQAYLQDTWNLARFFQDLFSRKDCLPVTANAGLHNPGCTGRLVCENITSGRDLEKYFRIGEPFALVIPVPFCNGELDVESYNGSYRNQQDIDIS